MALSVSEISRIARLARLELSHEEALLYAQQLGRVVEYIDQIARHEARAGEPTEDRTASTETTSRLAGTEGDTPGPTLDVAELLRNAPASLDRFLVVPQVK
jgi:aspartyl-tRNA(Asn)/glutamyl-tRNA(Gln) amidotransferase subunit C